MGIGIYGERKIEKGRQEGEGEVVGTPFNEEKLELKAQQQLTFLRLSMDTGVLALLWSSEPVVVTLTTAVIECLTES